MTRDENRQAMLARLPKGGICAEVGVWEGNFSAHILAITRPKRLHLIDPWTFQPAFGNSAFGREGEDAMHARYRAVRARYAGDPRVVVHRRMSQDALSRFADGELDWVYLDGNHNYEVVSADLALCLRKVRPGGVIAGDDFFWKRRKGAPVERAVREVLARLGDAVSFSRMGQQYLLRLASG